MVSDHNGKQKLYSFFIYGKVKECHDCLQSVLYRIYDKCEHGSFATFNFIPLTAKRRGGCINNFATGAEMGVKNIPVLGPLTILGCRNKNARKKRIYMHI